MATTGGLSCPVRRFSHLLCMRPPNSLGTGSGFVLFFPAWNWTAIGICFSQLDLLCQPLCVLRPLSGHLTSFSALTGASGQLVTPARQVTSIQQCSRRRQVPALPRIVLPRRVCPEYIRVVRSSPFLQARSHFPHGHRGDFLVRSLFSCLHVVSVSGSNLSPAAVLEPSPKLLESGARLYPLPPVLWLEAELAARSEVLPRPGDELQASPSCLIGTEATPCCPEAPAGNTPGMDGAL